MFADRVEAHARANEALRGVLIPNRAEGMNLLFVGTDELGQRVSTPLQNRDLALWARAVVEATAAFFVEELQKENPYLVDPIDYLQQFMDLTPT